MALNMTSNTSVDTHPELLDIIQKNHDEAYLYVSQGLAFQEQERYDLSRDMYIKGLEKINKALEIRCDQDFCKGPKWDTARKLQEKMRKNAQQIKVQLRKIAPQEFNEPLSPPYTPPEPFELPPSYDEAIQHDVIASPRRSSCPTYSTETKDTNLACNGHHRNSSDVVNLFSIPGDVQLFFVSFDGSVSTTTSQSSLNIYQFLENNDQTSSRPPAWLQIGSWTYPLIPGQSPALESGYGAFLFPNIGAGRDSAVGVILPPSVSPSQREEFLKILNSLTALREEKWAEPGSWKEEKETDAKPASFSENLSKGIVIGAEYLSAGIVKGAQMSSSLIHKGASKACQKIRPEVTPVSVDPRVREGLKIAHEASGYALKATGFLVKKLGDLTVALANQLAPHIREQGTKLLASTVSKNPQQAQDTMDGVLTIAAGGVQGFSTIYMGLENAARTLAYSLSEETVNIVGHKYGNEVGEVVGNAVFSVGNLALTAHNVQTLGPKAIAKRTAKDAGKAVLKDYAGQHVELPGKPKQ